MSLIYMEGSIKEKLKNSRANEGFTSRFFRDTNGGAVPNMLKDFCIYCTRDALKPSQVSLWRRLDTGSIERRVEKLLQVFWPCIAQPNWQICLSRFCRLFFRCFWLLELWRYTGLEHKNIFPDFVGNPILIL